MRNLFLKEPLHIILLIVNLVLIFFFITFCNNPGNTSLGSNLIIWEGDVVEDRAIVYCEGNCNGGIYVLPNYSKHYDSSGQYAEYLEKAKSNRNWVIAKTLLIKGKKVNYWIINKNFNIKNLNCSLVNCDSIIQSYVIGPLSQDEFKRKLQDLKIELKFY